MFTECAEPADLILILESYRRHAGAAWCSRITLSLLSNAMVAPRGSQPQLRHLQSSQDFELIQGFGSGEGLNGKKETAASCNPSKLQEWDDNHVSMEAEVSS